MERLRPTDRWRAACACPDASLGHPERDTVLPYPDRSHVAEHGRRCPPDDAASDASMGSSARPAGAGGAPLAILPGAPTVRARRGSTGVARRDEGIISVRAGSDPLDQRLTLLHELAHWLTPRARRRRTAPAPRPCLLRRRLRPLPPPRPRPTPTRCASSPVATARRSGTPHALGVPGARRALAAHRAAIRSRPTTPMARPRARACRPARARRPMDRMRDLRPARGRPASPASTRAAPGAPRAHDVGRPTLGRSRRQRNGAGASRASAAASASRLTASGVRGRRAR